MAATKFMDALARCPGNDGEDSDAVAAYTQVRIDEDLTYLLGKGAKSLTLGLPSRATGGLKNGRKMERIGMNPLFE